MNKHDFYKEIMSRYTFDEEKIRKTAVRASSGTFFARNSKWLPLTAACFILMISAAVILPFVINDGSVIEATERGTSIVTPVTVIDNDGVIQIVGENGNNNDGVSVEQRLGIVADMEDRLLNEGFTYEKKEMYVSFGEPMSQSELEAAFRVINAEVGTVEIVSLWASEDGGFAEVGVSRSGRFNAVKIVASDDLYFELKNVPEFSVIEVGHSAINDETFSPITAVMNDPVDITGFPETTLETVTNPSFTLPDNTITITETTAAENLPIITQTPPTVTEAPLFETEPPVSADIPFDTAPPFVDTAPPVTDEPPVQEIPLPLDYIEIDVENAVSVNFINENRFILLTQNQINLCEAYKDENGVPGFYVASVYPLAFPEVVYTDLSTGTRVILGYDVSGRRTELLIADSASGELLKLDTSGITDDINVALFRENDVIIATNRAVYTADRWNGYRLVKAVDISAPDIIELPEEATDGVENENENAENNQSANQDNTLILLGFANAGFKYAVISGDGAQIYRYNAADGVSEETNLGLEINENTAFVRGPNARNFAIITENGAYIFNANLSAPSEYPVQVSSLIFHRYSGRIFNDGIGNWYILESTQIVPITEQEAYALVPEPIFSNSYRPVEITPYTVKIQVL